VRKRWMRRVSPRRGEVTKIIDLGDDVLAQL
jgi:hypothetical protein